MLRSEEKSNFYIYPVDANSLVPVDAGSNYSIVQALSYLAFQLKTKRDLPKNELAGVSTEVLLLATEITTELLLNVHHGKPVFNPSTMKMKYHDIPMQKEKQKRDESQIYTFSEDIRVEVNEADSKNNKPLWIVSTQSPESVNESGFDHRQAFLCLSKKAADNLIINFVAMNQKEGVDLSSEVTGDVLKIRSLHDQRDMQLVDASMRYIRQVKNFVESNKGKIILRSMMRDIFREWRKVADEVLSLAMGYEDKNLLDNYNNKLAVLIHLTRQIVILDAATKMPKEYRHPVYGHMRNMLREFDRLDMLSVKHHLAHTTADVRQAEKEEREQQSALSHYSLFGKDAEASERDREESEEVRETKKAEEGQPSSSSGHKPSGGRNQ